MKFDKQTKELALVKDKIREKFKSQGLDGNQIQIQMNSIDCEFMIHAFINTISNNNSSIEEKLKFYIGFLKENL